MWSARDRGPEYWNSPNPARVHAVIADGARMYQPDEDAVAAVMTACPGWGAAARTARAWVWLTAAEAAADGTTQFADLGCGFPAHRSVHTAAGGVGRDPHLPIAACLGGLLEALTDAEAANLLRILGDLLAPGSRILLTQFSSATPAPVLDAAGIWRSRIGPFHLRSRSELDDLVRTQGWEPAPPGIGPLGRWGHPFADVGVLAAVAMRPPRPWPAAGDTTACQARGG
jgi:hypothetical protein